VRTAVSGNVNSYAISKLAKTLIPTVIFYRLSIGFDLSLRNLRTGLKSYRLFPNEVLLENEANEEGEQP
jgi:hypothetical protein